jgi:hypothetical protein
MTQLLIIYDYITLTVINYWLFIGNLCFFININNYNNTSQLFDINY